MDSRREVQVDCEQFLCLSIEFGHYLPRLSFDLMRFFVHAYLPDRSRTFDQQKAGNEVMSSVRLHAFLPVSFQIRQGRSCEKQWIPGLGKGANTIA